MLCGQQAMGDDFPGAAVGIWVAASQLMFQHSEAAEVRALKVCLCRPLQVPTVLIARTDADSATLLTSDIDEVDRAFCTGERTPEGFFKVKAGVEVSCSMRCHLSRPCCSDALRSF